MALMGTGRGRWKKKYPKKGVTTRLTTLDWSVPFCRVELLLVRLGC
jgi:hypothetical protein